MRRSSASFLFSLLFLSLCGQQREVQVGLLRNLDLARLIATSTQGSLQVFIDGERSADLPPKDGLRISVQGDGLSLKSLSGSRTATHSIELVATGRSLVRIATLDEPRTERTYPGRIEVRRAGNHLRIVDHVPLEEYVAGVVQSEAGDHKDIEYYKLQAVSCRTYALTNARKHAGDGFGVCDGTHCQVFKGRCTIDAVIQAADATRDLVVVDAGIHLIHATFHSNCGGETMNAEDLWSKSEPYLVSTLDTFCLRAPHATWRKSMPRTKWIGYLQRTYGLDPADSASVRIACDFTPGCRSLYIDGARPLIPLEQVRADMKFNSARFNIWSSGDEVIFDGRGFGHGVGLCQEGAMRMASLGIPYADILHHYFAEVHLVDVNTLDFFRDEGR